jgi:hypothetical protein
MPYILKISKEKSQNSFFNNNIFSWRKCWQQIYVWYNTKFTFWTNSRDTIFSILHIEDLECPKFHFLFWKVYCFFFTPFFPSSSTIGTWLS